MNCECTGCGIINEVSKYPHNYDTPDSLTVITFDECLGPSHTFYGSPDLQAINDDTVNLDNYEECNYARYCWVVENAKKIIKKWETKSPASDDECELCCKYCCQIDFSFLGSPIGGSGGGGPPSLCPEQYKTYRYRLANNGQYTIEYEFTNPNPSGPGKIIFDKKEDTVGPNEEKIILVHYRMPGKYDDPCNQDSYTFTHDLEITIQINQQQSVECTPIKSSIYIECRDCPAIECCNEIDGLFSNGNMQRKDPSGQWLPINIIPFANENDATWNPHFGTLDDQLHNNCQAEYVYGDSPWNNPKQNQKNFYKLDFTIPAGKIYNIAFSACVDDHAEFKLLAPGSTTPTEFFVADGTDIYNNFYAYYENDQGEKMFCLTPGDYTLFIDHWDTGGVRYGLMFAATKCSECADLKCDGTISWNDIEPGATVTDTFQVSNDGGANSYLNWEITEYPTWGTWTFTPDSGTNLKTSDGPTNINVIVEAPNDANTDFTGEIKIENTNNPEDYEILTATLSTPKSKIKTIIPSLLEFLENYPLLYRLLKLNLRLI